jgi:hypothetical protein
MTPELEKLIATINGAAPEAWSLLVRAELVTGWTDLLARLFGAAVCAVLGVKFYKGSQAAQTYSHDETPLVCLVGAWVALAFGVFLVALSIAHADRIVAPEASAARELLR